MGGEKEGGRDRAREEGDSGESGGKGREREAGKK